MVLLQQGNTPTWHWNEYAHSSQHRLFTFDIFVCLMSYNFFYYSHSAQLLPTTVCWQPSSCRLLSFCPLSVLQLTDICVSRWPPAKLHLGQNPLTYPFEQMDSHRSLKNSLWNWGGLTTICWTVFPIIIIIIIESKKHNIHFKPVCFCMIWLTWTWSFLIGAVRWSVSLSVFGRWEELSRGHLCICLAELTCIDQHNAFLQSKAAQY